MSDDKLDFVFTIDDLDRMVIDAARGEEGQEKKVKAKRPNVLEVLRTGSKLTKLNPRKRE